MSTTLTFHHTQSDASSQLTDALGRLIARRKEIVFLCIGTDRSTGDSFGPMVGTYLTDFLHLHPSLRAHVYGTLHNPVHAQNLEQTLQEAKENHPRATIVAIDACLGRLKSVGNLNVNEGSLQPGSGVGKELPAVGDISIAGVVNVSGFMEFFVLQNTRLSIVMDMAKVTSNAIQDHLLSRVHPAPVSRTS